MQPHTLKTAPHKLFVQNPLFQIQPMGIFPSTRYQGSKSKLVEWIWEKIAGLEFKSCLDAFGGTGCVSYQFKKMGKIVTYNDVLRFNYFFGVALIENKNITLTDEDINWVLAKHNEIDYRQTIQTEFQDIYFTAQENAWLDQTLINLYQLEDRFKFAMAFFALCQSCIIKRPYNLFHRKNLYIRFADVERSFGNKTSWDKPFEDWFRFFCNEVNQAVFDNGVENKALNVPALEITGDFDLVYLDTPYISSQGGALDYRDFYHFLEGMTFYDQWLSKIDPNSKHKRLKPIKSEWNHKLRIHNAFDQLFDRYQSSTMVISYRSDGIPSETELIALLKKYKANVKVDYFGQYTYALSKNSESKEILIIATD